MNIVLNGFDFEGKVIFKKTSFKSYPNEVTVIMGESGSGKSTFLNIIAGELKTNNIKVKRSKIAYVKQNPNFMADIKMKDHIKFLENAYNRRFNKQMISDFSLENTLESYPNNLSGGEKLKWGIILGIFKNKRYLICDEPTASLDWVQKEIVLKYLKAYAQKGNHVIISTHDSDVLKYTSRVYLIENKELVLKKEIDNHQEVTARKSQKLTINGLYGILRRNIGYQWKIRFSKLFILSISIILMALSFKFDEKLLQLNEMVKTDKEEVSVIVYKEVGGKKDAELSYLGREQQLSIEEVNQIKEISHIDSISPMYHGRYYSCYTDPLYGEYENITSSPLTLIHDKQEIVIYSEEETSIKNSDAQYFDSYVIGYDEEDVDMNDLRTSWSTEKYGIYINSLIEEMLLTKTGLSSLENCELKIQLTIPVYQSNGGSTTTYSLNGDEYTGLFLPIYSHVGQPVEVTLPILGVVNENKLGSLELIPTMVSGERLLFIGNVMYIPNDIIFEYCEQYKAEEEIKIYSVTSEDYQITNYINHYPTDEEIGSGFLYQKLTLTPYTANSYKVHIKETEYAKEVIGELENMGFGVLYDESIESQSPFLTFIYQKSFTVLNIFFIIVSIICVILSQIFEKQDKHKTQLFFENTFSSKKYSKKLMLYKYLINVERLFILSVGLLGFIILYLNNTVIYRVELKDTVMILIALLMSFIYELVIPVLIGGKKND